MRQPIEVGQRVAFLWPDGTMPKHGVVRDILTFNRRTRYGVQPDGYAHTWDVWDYAPYEIWHERQEAR